MKPGPKKDAKKNKKFDDVVVKPDPNVKPEIIIDKEPKIIVPEKPVEIVKKQRKN